MHISKLNRMEPQAYFLCESRYISAEHIGRSLSLNQCILKVKTVVVNIIMKNYRRTSVMFLYFNSKEFVKAQVFTVRLNDGSNTHNQSIEKYNVTEEHSGKIVHFRVKLLIFMGLMVERDNLILCRCTTGVYPIWSPNKVS